MKKMILLTFLIIVISYFIIGTFDNSKLKEFNFNEKSVIRVMRNSKNIIEEIPFESYIVGVLAGEMPISFDMEALKAQAVASRSYAIKKMKYNKDKEYDVVDTTNNQVYLDLEYLKKTWNKSYEKNINKIYEAVKKTEGEYVLYNGEIIDAFFFSTSTGVTENSENVFSKEIPYLKSVISTWDEISPVYEVKKKISLNDFYKKLGIKYNEKIDIKIIDKSETNKIIELSINNKNYSGGQIVDIFNLKSSYFTIKQDKQNVIITTKGYGHGVGMSQYGAQAMALKGYNYKEILKYYYHDVEVEKI